MNITLTPELEEFVETEVKRGVYPTASEVIRAGLRRLREDKEHSQDAPSTMEELETRLLHSIDRLDRGEGVESEAAFARLYARIRERRARG